MVRRTNQEETAIGKIVCYSQFQRGRTQLLIPCRATQGSINVGQKAKKIERKCEQKSLLWFPWGKKQVKWDKKV